MRSENYSSSKVNTLSGSQDKYILKSKVGMTFNSFEEREMFYKKYAKEMGFVDRRHTTRLDKETRDNIYQSLVCSKEGLLGTKAPRQDGQPQRKRAIIKEDCMVYMKLHKNDDGKWFVKKFEESIVMLL
ncbi:FAR1 domain-containing protein [Cephalotus follicularis]|uniref:FAR1 domain-containing protein n=1 Tax=Cephalotus follicularis TaxID=3775 RepID=A0A1Q3CQN4_CEPFO|nr:FAR1 domain-containing protein [Cephalotus follicularis]